MKTLGRILIIVLVLAIISFSFYYITIAANGGTISETQNFERQENPLGKGERNFAPEGGRGEHGEHSAGGGDMSRNLLKVSGAVLVIAGGTWAVEQNRKKKLPAAT